MLRVASTLCRQLPLLQPGQSLVFLQPYSFASSRLSYKWNHTVMYLLSLASFTQCNAAEIHPPCLRLFYVSTICFFVSLRSVFLYSITDLFIHSLAEGHVNCFQFLVNVNWATINVHIWCVCVCVYACVCVYILLIPEDGITIW